MKFQTIILRFRDLVTETGETINQHKEIIKEKGSVWWAWWRKGNEQLPIEEYSILRSYAEDTSVTIYLLDSGCKKLYRATCKNIRFQLNSDRGSPDTVLTPAYYHSQKYAAWFLFTQIEECSPEEIRSFSYVQVDSLFIDYSTNYTMFSDKRIYDLNELIQQNRTVWFVRPFSATDPDHEIILLNAGIAEPEDFSKKYYEVNGNSLLWLSDLHFSEKLQFPISKQKEPDRNTLTDHIRHVCDGFSDICGLVITGDITDKGGSAGFEIAKDFIEDLNRNLPKPLSSETLIFCPGNHDFIRKSEELKGNTPDLLSNHPDSMQAYQYFYHSVYSRFPNSFLCCGRKILMASGRTIEIVSLNSLILQQYEDFEGHGFISQEQLEFVADKMGWAEGKESNSIRIAMMHHHYLPTCLVEKIDSRKASSVVYDAERLRNWLNKYNVRLLLHGHKHRSFAAAVEFPYQQQRPNSYDFINNKQTYIVGMGSTGATDCENMFAVIHFLLNSIQIDFYRIYSDNIREDRIYQTISIPL